MVINRLVRLFCQNSRAQLHVCTCAHAGPSQPGARVVGVEATPSRAATTSCHTCTLESPSSSQQENMGVIIRGVATKCRLGGRIPTGGGGPIQLGQNYLPPNSDFSSDFLPLYFGNTEKSKLFGIYSDIFLKKSRFVRGILPEF